MKLLINGTEVISNPDFLSICNAVRQQRNISLQQSDWTQTLDAPVNKEAWATYRQELRDFLVTNQQQILDALSSGDDPAVINFPEPPRG